MFGVGDRASGYSLTILGQYSGTAGRYYSKEASMTEEAISNSLGTQRLRISSLKNKKGQLKKILPMAPDVLTRAHRDYVSFSRF
jgi:hypothetical protein